ncbi:MAG: DUF2802 domain-containing protein [Gammaproteobacteria bacterium]|nr:DUF2802 domain-containing protein [Gammaproteobacteria bacterium]
MIPVVIFGLGIALLLLAGILAQTLQTLRGMQSTQARIDADIEVLRKEITAVGQGAVGLGKRLQVLQRRQQSTERRQEDLEFKDVGNIAITHANKLVQMGAATDELMSTCGLSQAEANLVSLMHGKAKQGQRG